MAKKIIDMTNLLVGQESVGPVADISRNGYMEEDNRGLEILKGNLENILLKISSEHPGLDRKQKIRVLVSTIVYSGSGENLTCGRDERKRVYTYESLLTRYREYTGKKFDPVQIKADEEERIRCIVLSML